MADNRPHVTDDEALRFHSQGRPGKLEIVATNPMRTQRDLSLAYSPGVPPPVEPEHGPQFSSNRAVSPLSVMPLPSRSHTDASP